MTLLAGLLAQDIHPLETVLGAEAPEEIVITGTRQPLRRSELTSAVSVLTAADLEARQITRVVDALKALPGVAVANGGGAGGVTQLRLRGSEANHVLVIIDGIEVNDAAAGDELQFEHLVITDIERIELIRGPQSAVWGSDALAGVINIVTRKGDGQPSGRFRAEGGSFGTYNLGANVGAGGDGWHASAGVDWRDIRGVNASRTGNEADGYENLTLNTRAGVTLFDDRLSLDGSLRYEDGEAAFDTTDFATSLPADSDNITNTEKLYSGLTARFDVIEGRWTQTARVTYVDTEIANTANGAFDGVTRSEVWGYYTDSLITLAEGHRINLFLDHEETDFSQRGIVQPFGDPNQNRSLSVTGYGASYVGALAKGVTANLALRQDDNSDFGNITTWAVGLSGLLPATNTRLFASVARGQRAPTLVERFGFFTNFQGNANLRPERSLQYEAGFEQSFGTGARLTVTAFWADLEQEINGFVFDPETFLFTAGNNEGDSTRRGVEADFEMLLTPTLSLTGHYSFVRSREPDAFDPAQTLTEVRRPSHQAALGFLYQPTAAVRLSVDIDYTGRAFDNFFDPLTFAASRVRLDDYLLVRVAADLEISQGVALTGRVENLLDENYEDILGFNTPGLGAFGGLRVSF